MTHSEIPSLRSKPPAPPANGHTRIPSTRRLRNSACGCPWRSTREGAWGRSEGRDPTPGPILGWQSSDRFCWQVWSRHEKDTKIQSFCHTFTWITSFYSVHKTKSSFTYSITHHNYNIHYTHIQLFNFNLQTTPTHHLSHLQTHSHTNSSRTHSHSDTLTTHPSIISLVLKLTSTLLLAWLIPIPPPWHYTHPQSPSFSNPFPHYF